MVNTKIYATEMVPLIPGNETLSTEVSTATNTKPM
jgi:hypothetical protein